MKKFWLLSISLLTIALHALTGQYPDAAVILLTDREKTVYQTDGTAETVDLCRYRIMNYDGLLQMRTMNLHFNAAYGDLQITTLEIEKPDGRKIILDPAKLARIAIDSGQMQSRIYDPAQKQLSVTIPGLEINDILTLGVKRRLLKPRIPGEWSDICVLQGDFPILDYEYIIDAPAEKPLQSISIKNKIEGTVSFAQQKKQDRIIYSWRARNVPQAIPEPAMPELYTCCQRVLTSTVKNWQDISRWYDRLCAPQLAKVNDAMRRKTAELTAGTKTPMEKITALFQFVSQQIRYTGITDEEHAPGYEPHAVSQTFDRRHGVCRDKAALLVAMLRLADIEAYPVLFMSGTPKDAEVPNIYFNHAIVTAVIDGKYVLMDPTFETTRELLPSYLAGDSFLVAKPGGDTLRTVPPVPPENNMLTVNTAGTVDKKGGVTGETVLNFTGTYDQMYRSAFSEWNAAERDEFFAARLRKLIPGAAVKKLTVTPENIRDMSVPLTVKIAFSADNYISPGSGVRLFAMPRLAHSFGMLETVYSLTALGKRQFPLRALPRSVKEQIKVTLPENITAAAVPPPVNAGKKGLFRFNSSGKITRNTLSEEHFFAMDSMLISPQEYPELKKALAAAAKAGKNLPVIHSVLDLRHADSVILEHTEKFHLHHAFSWDHEVKVKRQILNYAGMSNHSEIRIPYIEGVDNIEISGQVTAPDGSKHTLSAKELNRMDAPGAGTMARYPRCKIAVASFPNVVPGSVIEYTVNARYRDKYHVPYFVFRSYTPAMKQQVTFNMPEKYNLHLTGQTGFAIPLTRHETVSQGRREVTVAAVNIPALDPEYNSPDLRHFVPTATVSGIPAAEFAKYAENSSKVPPEIQKLARQITAGKSGRSAIEALAKYTAKHIRPVNYPLNIQLLSAYSAPQVTLADGYGSSADRAILLAALLKASGIRYEFVPASMTPHFYRTDFTELLLKLPDHPGVYLNDGGLHSALGAARNRTILDGSKVRKLYPEFKDQQTLNCTVKLDGSGNARITMEYRFHGTLFEREAEKFAKFTPELTRRHFEKLAAAIAPNAVVVSREADFSKHPGRINFTVEVQEYAVFNGKFAAVELPGFANVVKAAAMPPEQRILPYLAPQVFLAYDYRISVPEKWQAIPKSHLIQKEFFNMYNLPGSCKIRLISPELQLIGMDYLVRCRIAGEISRPETGKIIFKTE